MRSDRNMTQTVRHDDAIKVPTESNTIEIPKLSIVGVDPELGFAGGETQVLGLTVALAGSGHRAELICDPAGRLWERAIAAGIRCHPLRIRNAIDLAAGVKLRAILKRERYDVVHFHTSRAHSMAPLARGFASTLVVTRRMDYRPNRVFAPYLFNRAVDGVVAISAGVADSLAAAGVDRQRVTVVHSGVDCGHFRPPTIQERADARGALGISDDEILISAVGALEQRKGHRYLIEAIGTIADARKVQVPYRWSGFDSCSAATRNRSNQAQGSNKAAWQNRRHPRTAVGVGHLCDAVTEGRSRRGGPGSDGERIAGDCERCWRTSRGGGRGAHRNHRAASEPSTNCAGD